MLKSRTAMTVIGVIVIGSASVVGVLLTTANRGPSTHNATAHTVSTATSGTTHTPTSSTSSPTSGTGAPASSTLTPTSPKPTQPPSGQVVDLHCTNIANIDPGNNQFTCTDAANKTWTIRVTDSTTYEGAAHSFSDLKPGMKAEVSGVPTGATTFLAYHVNAETP